MFLVWLICLNILGISKVKNLENMFYGNKSLDINTLIKLEKKWNISKEVKTLGIIDL